MTSPVVTEGEVSQLQNFFERISSTIVAHSAQVRELADLRQQVSGISSRLDTLSNENDKLRSDLSQAWNAYESVKAERDTAKAEAEQQARDATAARGETATVRQDYEQKLGVAHDQIDARDTRIAQLEDQLKLMTEEKNTWQGRSDRFEGQARSSEDKLIVLQGHFNDMATRVRSLFEPPAPKADPVPSFASWTDQPKDEPEPAKPASWPFAANG